MATKKDYSRKFHDKINKLLEDVGFKIEEINYNKPGPDTICSVEGNRILVQCKSAEKYGKSFQGIKRLADEYETKARKLKAKVSILAFGGYTIPEKFLADKLLKENKVVVWNDRIINYYKESVNSLKKYAKYQLMGDMGIFIESEDKLSVPALRAEQNGKELFVFKMIPEDLLKYGYVFRRQYNPKAYQRMLKKSRLEEIGTFVKDKGNVFPNNIICVFKDKVIFNEKTNRLIIPRKYSSIWIVDGQHRLYGFCYANKEIRERGFQLVCVGFNIRGIKKSQLGEDQQARLFYEINSKAKKIPQELILEIKDLFGVYDRRVAIVKRLMKTELFKNRIQTTTTKGDIHFTTFVTTPPMDDLVLEDKKAILIDEAMSKKYKNISDEQKRKKYEDICFKIINDYFAIIKKLYKNYWSKPKKYILSTDRGIRALLRLLIQIIKHTKKWDNKKSKAILKNIKDFNFKNDSLKNKYLGEGGAEEFANDLAMLIQKSVPGFGLQSEKIYDELIKINEISKAEAFVKKHFTSFEGEVIGQLMYIDDSTIKYLKLIPPACGIRLIVRHIKNDDAEAIRAAIKNEMKGWKYIRIKQIKALNESNQERALFHGRWVADSKDLINLDVDLKKDSLNTSHEKSVYNNPQCSKRCQEFRKLWDLGPGELEEYFNVHKVEILEIN